MSYFPCDIPFMSEEELRENGIKIHKDTETTDMANACDLISRQAAIDAHYEYCNKHPDAGFSVWSLKILKDLPSAQPETHDKRTETHGVCLDAIDRQVAINALHDEIVRRRINEDSNDDGALDEFDTEAILRRLPSAQPQRTGRWINHVEDGYVECPFCHSATNCDDNISELHFCFSCGADMRGEQDE